MLLNWIRKFRNIEAAQENYALRVKVLDLQNQIHNMERKWTKIQQENSVEFLKQEIEAAANSVAEVKALLNAGIILPDSTLDRFVNTLHKLEKDKVNLNRLIKEQSNESV